MRPGISAGVFQVGNIAVDAEIRSDGVGLLLPLGRHSGLVGDLGVEAKLSAVCVEPAEEVVAFSGRGDAGGLFAVLNNLRVGLVVVIVIEDHFIQRRSITPDGSGVLVAGVPAAASLAVGRNDFVEQLAVSVLVAGEAELDLDVAGLVGRVDFKRLLLQRLEHVRVVDGLAELIAIAIRPRIGLGGVGLDYHNGRAVEAEIRSDDVGVRLPLCGEDHVARGDGVGSASLEERFIGRIVCAVSVKLGGIIFIRNDFNAPALEGIAFAGRVGGHGDCAAGDVVVVDIAVVVHRHGFRRCAVAVELDPVERQLTVEVIAFALAELVIAPVSVVGGHVLQLRPNGLADICLEARRIRMRGVGAGFQLALDGIEPGFSDIRHLRVRQKRQSRGHFADRDPLFVGVVIAAELAGRETGTCERVRVQRTFDVLLQFILDRRVLVNQLLALGIDGLDEEVDVGGGLVFRCAAFAVDCCCAIAGCFQSPRAVLPFPCDGDELIARGMGLAGVGVKLSDEVVLVHRDRIGIRAILFGFGGVGVMGSKGIHPESRIMICRARGAVYTNHQIPIDSRRVIVAGDVRRRLLLAAVTGVTAVRFYAVAVFVSVHALVAVVAIAVAVAVFVYMLFPLRVERHGRGCAGQRDRRRSDVRAHRIHPALEVIALTDRLHRGDGERPAGGCRRLRLIGRHVRDRVVSDIIVVLQLVGVLGLGGLLRNEVNSVVGQRAKDHVVARIKRMNCGIGTRSFLRPADKFIACFQFATCRQRLRGHLDIRSRNSMTTAAAISIMICAGECSLFPRLSLVAKWCNTVINVQDIAVDLRVASGRSRLPEIVYQRTTAGTQKNRLTGLFIAAAVCSNSYIRQFPAVVQLEQLTDLRDSITFVVRILLGGNLLIPYRFVQRAALNCIFLVAVCSGRTVYGYDAALRLCRPPTGGDGHRRYRQHAEYHNQN